MCARVWFLPSRPPEGFSSATIDPRNQASESMAAWSPRVIAPDAGAYYRMVAGQHLIGANGVSGILTRWRKRVNGRGFPRSMTGSRPSEFKLWGWGHRETPASPDLLPRKKETVLLYNVQNKKFVFPRHGKSAFRSRRGPILGGMMGQRGRPSGLFHRVVGRVPH